MLRSKCATLVLRGGGNVSWGRLVLVFPGFAPFARVVDFGYFLKIWPKIVLSAERSDFWRRKEKNSFFLRNAGCNLCQIFGKLLKMLLSAAPSEMSFFLRNGKS